jgi:hypothetical protein
VFQNNTIKRDIRNKKVKIHFYEKGKICEISRVILFLKLCILMPEDDRKHPKHVACIVEYNKFDAFDGNV